MSELSENDIVTKINMTLETLLNTMTFCEHDSEYRMVVTEETPKILEQLNNWLDILHHSNNEYYLYGSDPYPTTTYRFGNSKYHEHMYAFKNFQIISKKHYIQYCENNHLNPDDFIYKNSEKEVFKQSLKLSGVVNRLTNKNVYRLPHTIYFLSKNHDGTSTQFHLNKFKFIDVLKIAKALE